MSYWLGLPEGQRRRMGSKDLPPLPSKLPVDLEALKEKAVRKMQRQRHQAKTRQRAMQALAELYPEDFQRLLAEARAPAESTEPTV